MKPTDNPYPVDRYLVESSKKYDMINIIDDDIWNSEPAFRPEDEIILRKLHDMLQSTADDLKLLSGELSKYHESGVQKKIMPTPLDEDFNEKVHIEEVVSAKFHGLKLESTEHIPQVKHKGVIEGVINSRVTKNNVKQYVNHGVQVNQAPTKKKLPVKKNLKLSRTNIIQINERPTQQNIVSYKDKSDKSVIYNELFYKYAEPQQISIEKKYQIQQMPSIDIRSELREQKVLHLDIIPSITDVCEEDTIKNNALVIEVKHEDIAVPSVPKTPLTFNHIQYIPEVKNAKLQPVTRKISKMSVCESSESTNNISSESQSNLLKHNYRTSTKLHIPPQVAQIPKREQKRPTANTDRWHRKLKAVYGGPSKSGNSRTKGKKVSPKKSYIETDPSLNKPKALNNTVYIPYSKLTIGGVNVSDIEKEISNIPNRNQIVLSPILDKILSSRENSFYSDSPRKTRKNKGSKIFTTSDENLLQEVLHIEKEVTRTLGENMNNKDIQPSVIDINKKDNDHKDGDSYDDDFEDEKSGNSEQVYERPISSSSSQESLPPNNSHQDDNYNKNILPHSIKNREQDDTKRLNKTFTKISNLSFKNSIDVFEYVHSIDTQDTGTQSNTIIKISPRGTTASPKIDDRLNMQPIHNDLWPSIDPRGEVEKMFREEKEFIQKLILDEYGDLLEKQLNKPSTSKNVDYETKDRNVTASQKNTQTSPAHVKSVMTSPTRTKTRTTSPFALSLTVNQQTSPIICVSKDDELKVEIGKDDDDDLGLSVNLSSPRFSLRLPQTFRDNNIRQEIFPNDTEIPKQNNLRKNMFSSSSSMDGDYSSSDISSLGELNKMYKRKVKKSRIPSISEISTSSSFSRYSTDPSCAIIPFKSEGEASIGQINRRKSKQNKSEGEISLGQLNY